jgi:hypothetical protein
VLPGERLVSAPVVQASPAFLTGPVTFDVAGDSRSLPAETGLFAAVVGGDSGSALVGDAPAYCEPLRVNAKMAGKAVLNAAAFGIFGQALRTHAYSVLCFVDSDRDGRFDAAFHSGAQRKGDRVLTPVGPVGYSTAAPVASASVVEVSVVYGGESGGKLRFGLQPLAAGGKKTAFQERATAPTGKLPASVTIQGARIRILSYDKATKKLRLVVESGIAPGPVSFQPPMLEGLYEPVPKPGSPPKD